MIKWLDRGLNLIMSLFFGMLLIIGGYALIDSFYVIKNAEINKELLKKVDSQPKSSDATLIEDLKKINKDIVGWIKIDNTDINYPILQGNDNVEYLNKDYENNYSTFGSIFLDFRNSSTMEDKYIVIYGHNTDIGMMFSDINKLENISFFDKINKGSLYTEDSYYQLNILGFGNFNAYDNNIYSINEIKNRTPEDTYFYIKDKLKNTKEPFQSNQNILALSTCYGHNNNIRTILFVQMEKIDNNHSKE